MQYPHGFLTGAGIRTQDLRFRRPLLCPAELLPPRFGSHNLVDAKEMGSLFY